MIAFRSASKEDRRQIWPLWKEIAASTDSDSWHSGAEETDARAAWLLEPPARVYVAEDHGRVVGSAILRPREENPDQRVANAFVVVDPEKRHNGIGRQLTNHLLIEARAVGFSDVQLNRLA